MLMDKFLFCLPQGCCFEYIECIMNTWKEQLEKGKQYLFGQESRRALEELQQAMEQCPEENTMDLSEIMFFLGAAYRSLGYDDSAYQCWENAAMLRDSEDEDFDLDWKAFFRIQLVKYLSAKKAQKFSSLAESDMIHDLIKGAWSEVKHEESLAGCDFHQRCRYYRSVRIVFPRIETPEDGEANQGLGQIIPFSSIKQNNGKK